MQAVILAGGLGTRLRSLYPDLPKALVPILGKPFLLRQIEWLAASGIRDIHMASGYKAEAIRDWSRTGAPAGVTLTVSEEPTPLGTAGGLKYVEPHLRSDPFLVLNGDSLMPNLDFQSLEKTRTEGSKDWTLIVVTRIEESGRYGTVEFDPSGRVTAFREKAERKAGWINGGVYLMNRSALAAIEPGKNLSIETDIFPELARRSLLRAFTAPPPLLDMGTPEGIRAMESWFANR